jgi:hypothetical protein
MKAELPPGFDYADFCEVMNAIEGLLAWSRVGTFDEEAGEREDWGRATRLLGRYRGAT